MNSDMASQPRYIEPRLWPRIVSLGHVEFSTRCLDFRWTKWSVEGSKWIAKRAWRVWGRFKRDDERELTCTVSMISCFDTSVSPEYTTDTMSLCSFWIWAMAVHRTRSPPPPALLVSIRTPCHRHSSQAEGGAHQYG